MNTGIIIPIAYPDTFVRYSERGFQQKILSGLGLGSKGYIKAGHALLLLINKKNGVIEYFDFGRYVTPPGKGRVRSIDTDAELFIPIKANLDKNSELLNLKEILVWIEAHPDKTHGEGRMVASVCQEVAYEKAKNYLINLQSQGSIAYKTFGTIGSNCSRLVTDTLIESCTNPKTVKALKFINKFTPSPLGNVKHAATNSKIFVTHKGEFKPYKDSVFKENTSNYFDKNIPEQHSNNFPEKIGNKQLLEGVGASAYFELRYQESMYFISRYTINQKKDFEGIFKCLENNFDYSKKYKFVHDSNCSYCHIVQEKKVFKFILEKKLIP